MSWDIHFEDANGEQVSLAERHNLTGGTMAVGGTHEAWLNITYNYGGFFADGLGDHFSSLDKKTAAEAIPLLEAAIPRIEASEREERACQCHGFDCISFGDCPVAGF